MILLDKLHSQIYLYMLFTKDLGVFEDGHAAHRKEIFNAFPFR